MATARARHDRAMTTTDPQAPATASVPHRLRPALAWLAVTAVATTVIGLVAVEGVSDAVRAGGQSVDVQTLNPIWDAGNLLCVPVFLVARRSALLALPAVAVAVVPQFFVATTGLNRIDGDDGLEALIYLVPIMMTLLSLGGALVGGVIRVVGLRRERRTTQAS